MKILKGKSAEYLSKEYPDLRKKHLVLHIWARGYFVSTVGIDSDIIRRYVRSQQEEEVRIEQRRLWRDDG